MTINEIKTVLDGIGASYSLHAVPDGVGISVQEHLKAFGLDASQGCATLVFVTNKGPVALLRRDDSRVDNKALKQTLGVNKLRLADSAELEQIGGFSPGMVSPIGLQIPVYIDSLVLEQQTVRVGTGNNEFSLEIAVSDLVKITQAQRVTVCAVSLADSVIKQRILTGDRPTGPLHLGHYVGSVANRVKLQSEYDLLYLIADVQALTDNYANPAKVRDNVLQVAQDNLACGLDPEQATFLVQSQIPEIAELTVFFMNLVTHSEVLRNPTVKTEIQDKKFGESVPFGFVAYPVSQAADIQVFKANLVPVGVDQAPMIELARELGQKFNRLYSSNIFDPKLNGLYGVEHNLVGTDGDAKMSKSKGNTINLNDSEQEVRAKVAAMYTDPNRIHASDPGQVEGNPVFIYHDFFNSDKAEVADLKQRYAAGKVGDVEVKEKLAKAINEFLEPVRARRAEYPLHRVAEIVAAGTRRARTIAQATMTEVKEAMQIHYPELGR